MGEYPIDPADQAAQPNPDNATPGGAPSASTSAPAAHGATAGSAYYGAANPMPPWPHTGAATPPNQPYPQRPGEFPNTTQGTGYPNANPDPMGGYNAYGYPPYHPTPPVYYPPYPYHPPYSLPPGYQAAHHPPPLNDGDAYASRQSADINQLLNGVANGDGNSLATLGQMLNFDDRELWKGALIGAAAVLLLTNEAVQRALFRTGNRAKQALQSGLAKGKKAASQGQEGVEIPIDDDSDNHGLD